MPSSSRCSSCGDDVGDLDPCPNCGANACDDCIRECHICADTLCANCCYTCVTCDETVCGSHAFDCAVCGNTVCDSCRLSCPVCDRTICEDCLEENGCRGCRRTQVGNTRETSIAGIRMDRYNASPSVLSYSTTPCWKFYKKKWEKDNYMGIELEMENRDRLEEVLRVPTKFMNGKFIWKSDASIHDGAEMVLAPHSRQELLDIDWKTMLQELRDIGTSSYTNGRCGLHIHVNRSAISDTQRRRLVAFMSGNREKLRKFGCRTKCKMEAWSSIPIDWKTWNQALIDGCSERTYFTLTRKGTYEFRGFRGTLSLQRFRATIDFVDTLISFADCHGTPLCASDRSWGAFLDYADSTGRKYLVSQLKKIPYNYEKLQAIHAAEIDTAESEE